MPESADWLERCNVAWDSPSRDAAGSMPLGNGDVALNAWVEEGGDLLLLLAKSDAWDENSINLKLGRIRIALSPNPFNSGGQFRQVLDLRRARIDIQAGPPEAQVHLSIWIDANRPAVHVEASSPAPFAIRASLEIWREVDRTIKTQTGDLFKRLGGSDPYPTVVAADQIQPAENHRIVWLHHNRRREQDGYEINLRLQGLGDFDAPHPLLGRTFGAAMHGAGMHAEGPARLISDKPQRSHSLSIHVLTLHPATVEQWRVKLDQVIAANEAIELETARREHEQWWAQFWDRSFVDVTSTIESEKEAVAHLSQGYVLQRFMNAAAGRAGPIKFNGSLFSVGKDDDPDFRRWGGPGFWFQNQRLIYWPMLAAGDFDLLMPWLKMYRDMLSLQQHRTRRYFHHAGAHYPETVTFWGAEISSHYGWTPFEQRQTPEAESPYVRYYWTGGLELVAIMLAYVAYTSDDRFARDALIPLADAIITFYDEHYPHDENGKLRLEPSQTLETWQDATNPLPDIAGLRHVLPRLIELPHSLTSQAQRDRWLKLLDCLPPIPIGQKDGRRVLLPAQRFDQLKNVENPELYAIFPFSLYGIDKPDLELARNTFAARLHRSHDCWSQDDIQAALLGLTEYARQSVTARAAPAAHSASRFPAFWDAHHDWSPDMDHGGVLQRALQCMLMQTDDRRIMLLPAWPKQWNADFKLHAPMRTLVQGKVREGKVLELKVTPESRRQDVVICTESS